MLNNPLSTECREIADYGFLLDSSGSIVYGAAGNWGLVKDFMIRFVSHLPVGRDRNHYGVVQFSESAQLRFTLDRYYTQQSVARAILNLQNAGGRTNTQAGLNILRTQVFGRGGDRANVPNIAIVITDGRSTQELSPNTISAANELKAAGALVIAVGITNDVDENELRGIASGPRYVVRAPSFQELEQQLQNIIDTACTLITEPIGPPGMLTIYNKMGFVTLFKGKWICQALGIVSWYTGGSICH